MGSHLYTPGATLPATCHLKATEAAARQAPKMVIDRGTAVMAASTKRGDTTVLRAAAAAGAPICTCKYHLNPLSEDNGEGRALCKIAGLLLDR